MQNVITGVEFQMVLSSGSIKQEYQENFTTKGGDKFYVENLKITSTKLVETFLNETEIHFTNCTFESRFEVNPKFHKTALYFRECSFLQGLSIENGRSNNIGFNNCNLKECFIGRGQYDYIGINDCTGRVSLLKFNSKHLIVGNQITPNKNSLEEISIDFTDQTGIVRIERIKICSVQITGVLQKECSFFVNDLVLKHLYCQWFYMLGSFRINKLGVSNFPEYNTSYSSFNLDNRDAKRINRYYDKAIMRIHKSDLGKSHFNTVNLNGFELVNVSESNIYETNFIDVNWPREIFSFDGFIISEFTIQLLRIGNLKKSDFKRIKEVYRQLKLSSYKQSDSVSEQYFHGLEMKAYNKSLSFRMEPFTKTILYLSNWTSDYGQSIWRPIATIILLNSILFSILSTINFSTYSVYVDGKVSLQNLFAEFIKFVNPLHKNEPELTGFSFIIDTLARVISSYCIYNFIRASRRYVR